MSEPLQPPGAGYHYAVGPVPPPGAGAARPFDFGAMAIATSLVVAAATALLGLAAGYIWSLVAPRALLVVVSPGAAGLVHAETSAFIVADAAFCVIALAGGVVSGGLGYLLAVRRYGPVAMLGVLAGALAAGYLARWVGEQSGLPAFHHLLATLPAGAHLRDSLTLRASSALAFWPLAAGLTAGGLGAIATRRRHQGGAGEPVLAGPLPGAPQPWSTGLPPGPPGRPPGPPGRPPGLPGGQAVRD